MPHISMQQLQAAAMEAGIKQPKGATPIIQQSKAPPKEPARQALPKIRLPPKQLRFPSMSEPLVAAPKRYTEYRQGVMKGVFMQIGKTLPDSKQETFIDKIKDSKDIYDLLIDTALVHRLDEIAGPPKLLLTVIGKWLECSF